jgi:hypothetical protein
MEVLEEEKTWALARLHPGTKAVGNKLVYRVKQSKDENKDLKS